MNPKSNTHWPITLEYGGPFVTGKQHKLSSNEFLGSQYRIPLSFVQHSPKYARILQCRTPVILLHGAMAITVYLMHYVTAIGKKKKINY